MAGTLLGSYTIGGSVVGLSDAFDLVGSALQDLRAVVDVQVDLIDAAADAIDAQIGATNAAQIAIRLPATADFQAQVDASLKLQNQFSVQLSDPSAYITAMLSALGKLQSSFAINPPTAAVQTNLSGAAKIGVSASGKIAAVDLELEALAAVSAALQVQVDAAFAISAALRAAVTAILGALSAFVSLSTILPAVGARVILVDGPIADIGADIDAATPGMGLGAATPIRSVLVLVEQGDAAALGAFNATFRTSS